MRQDGDDARPQFPAEASELAFRLLDREREYARRAAFLDTAIARFAQDAALGDMLRRVRAVAADMHAQGYAVVPGFLDAAAVDRLRRDLEPLFATIRRVFAEAPPDGPRQTFHVHNVLAKTRAADGVATHPLLRAIVGGLLGPDFLLHAGGVVISPDPGCHPQGVHRDDASFSVLPRPRMPLVVTAAVALDDYTERNGATRLVPASHVWPGARRPDPDELVACELPAGSLLVWDGALFHAGGANVTADKSRRTLTFNYTRGWLRSQFNQFLSVPREVVLNLPPELQKDLGYQPSARGLGECDSADPLDYLRRLMELGGDGAQAALGPESR
jgi:ectoine hydroxylase-related dioxygenase (phytanoyl-CoA dioxygenase family)